VSFAGNTTVTEAEFHVHGVAVFDTPRSKDLVELAYHVHLPSLHVSPTVVCNMLFFTHWYIVS